MCTLLMLPVGVSAQLSQSNIYLSAFIDRQALGETDSAGEFNPILASAVVGYWVRQGIGLELEAGVGVSDDAVGDLDLDSSSAVALSLRLESQPRGPIAAYALLGYVRSSFDLSNSGFDTTITLPGGRIGLGLTWLVNTQLRVDAGFAHHDYDGDTRINSFRIGLRYDVDSRIF